MHARRLTTAAVLALAAAVLAAAPSPAAPSPGSASHARTTSARTTSARTVVPAGSTEVPVEHGSARFRLPSALLTDLTSAGVEVAADGAPGAAAETAPQAPAGDGMELRIEDGAVTNGGGLVGGELHLTGGGLTLTHRTTRRTVRLTRFDVGFGQGALRAGTGDRSPLTLGTFARPGIRSVLDSRSGVLRTTLDIALTQTAAARINAALGARCLTGGRPLLQAEIVATLDRSVDLRTALNLG
ncbi:hypothetical protein AB0C96_34495 [Streptomyces sp. NPDC048506]|uniref:hypothetical protein n=1 Tax=Streptomyces sp. NPDC048506 TaxID=3155028 RepID=UPI00342E7936